MLSLSQAAPIAHRCRLPLWSGMTAASELPHRPCAARRRLLTGPVARAAWARILSQVPKPVSVAVELREPRSPPHMAALPESIL